MLFAYLDESATPDEHFYFLGALLCTEGQALAIESGFEDLLKQFRAKDSVMCNVDELHGSEVFHGKKTWRRIAQGDRLELLSAAMGVVVAAEPHFFIRGVDTIALQRRNGDHVFSPYLLVMGHLMETVERFMRDQYYDDRVIVFADEHHADSDARAQLRLARENPIPGKVHVELSHFFDAAYYGPSEHSRLLQAVDLCTYFYQRSRYASEARDRWKQRYVEAIGAQVMSLTRHQHVWAP